MGDHIHLDALFDSINGIKKSELQIEIERNQEARREARMMMVFPIIALLATIGMWWWGDMPAVVMVGFSMVSGAMLQYNIRNFMYLRRVRSELIIREVMES